jgi:hypothetical protein
LCSFFVKSYIRYAGLFNKTLVAWAMKKYKHFKGHKTRAAKFLEGIAKRQFYLFVHWSQGRVGAFA